MPRRIPAQLLQSPQEILVVGESSCARVLAGVFGCGDALPSELLDDDPSPTETGGYPRAFDELRHALLVLSEATHPATALRQLRGLWAWVEKLSSAGEQHELAVVFVLHGQASKSYRRSLANGLALPGLEETAVGFGVWSTSDTLSDLLDLMARIPLADRVLLRAREDRDVLQVAIRKLRRSLQGNEPSIAREAAHTVQAAFQEQEYDLDLFCSPPSHHHGNLVRAWLRESVTSPLGADWWDRRRPLLDQWLA